MSESAPFMLDDVKVDPRRLRLEGLRGATAVEPRVMDVLVGLAAQGTDVVMREALERQVWPDTHVGYHALARAISQARRALHEVAPDRSDHRDRSEARIPLDRDASSGRTLWHRGIVVAGSRGRDGIRHGEPPGMGRAARLDPRDRPL